MNKNIAKIMLINLIIAQSACGMAPEQDIQLTPEQQQGCRDAIHALATNIKQTTPKVAAASFAGGLIAQIGTLVVAKRAGFSTESSAGLSLVALFAGLAGSAWLGDRFISQRRKTRLLEEAGQIPELRTISQETAHQLAEMFNSKDYNARELYRNAIGSELSSVDAPILLSATKALFTHLALMPREND